MIPSDTLHPDRDRALPWPSIYLSHGSPMIALEPGRTGAYFGTLGRQFETLFGKPKAIVAISAHSALPARARDSGFDAALLAAPRHAAIYDFGGFDAALSRLRYDVSGAPELAERVAALLGDAGFRTPLLSQGGLDHGIWTALRFLMPAADIPVLPLAWPMTASPDELWRLGAALAPLRSEGVLVMATGSITHNLRRVFSDRQDGHAPPPDDVPEIPESRAFRTWWAERAADRDWKALFDWARQAPHAADMHPSDEHLLPWFVAAGAGGTEAPAVRVHQGVTFGCLGMDAYAFGPGAANLAVA